MERKRYDMYKDLHVALPKFMCLHEVQKAIPLRVEEPVALFYQIAYRSSLVLSTY